MRKQPKYFEIISILASALVMRALKENQDLLFKDLTVYHKLNLNLKDRVLKFLLHPLLETSSLKIYHAVDAPELSAVSLFANLNKEMAVMKETVVTKVEAEFASESSGESALKRFKTVN